MTTLVLEDYYRDLATPRPERKLEAVKPAPVTSLDILDLARLWNAGDAGRRLALEAADEWSRSK